MNTELERLNGNEKNIQTEVFSNDDYHQSGVDIQCACKLEVHSEGEDGEECVVRQQMTEKYVEFAMKNENADPTGTTDDERYVPLKCRVYSLGSQQHHILG
jgi:hypothetical protein